MADVVFPACGQEGVALPEALKLGEKDATSKQ